ncbi:hypothetical protein [Pseudolysinimonas sp.]|uniref:hypothetical protein n=1 Tax=Pseudolysinimonas sp. TaxID=2680009 RepID=UPI003F7F490D
MTEPDDSAAQAESAALIPPLLEAARAAGTEGDGIAEQRALWRAVFALPRWLFIARGGLEEPRPFIGETPDGPTLFAFTEGARAQRFATEQLHLPEEEAGLVLAIPTASAVDWVVGFGEYGVTRIMFDDAFFAPLGNLLPIRADVAG